ncbi:hypothetical protein GW17_00029767 [Ensete ventricosum]|nr:hypothetical protein GW17_00029767 [Ensete ventricosum]
MQAAAALARRQTPCQGAATLRAPYNQVTHGHRATSDCVCERLPPLRASCSRSCPRVTIAPAGCCLCGWPPMGCCPYGRPPAGIQPAWPWVTAPARGLAMAGHSCKGFGCGWPPLLAVGREEIRRGRPRLQPINYESPLLFIKSHQKPKVMP